MNSYYTRAKARNEIEPEDVEQGDSAPETTTITVSDTTSVGLQGVSTRESGSMSAEVAGPVTAHPQLLPEGGHSSVGGHGNSGSADSLQVGVATLGYPRGLADPLNSTTASAVEGQITAGLATATATSSSTQLTSRQPPTTAEVTAAASRSPTQFRILGLLRLFFETNKCCCMKQNTDEKNIFFHYAYYKPRSSIAYGDKSGILCYKQDGTKYCALA